MKKQEQKKIAVFCAKTAIKVLTLILMIYVSSWTLESEAGEKILIGTVVVALTSVLLLILMYLRYAREKGYSASVNISRARPATYVRPQTKEGQAKPQSAAGEKVESAAMAGTQVKDTGVRFSDIAGYESTKQSVRFVVECLKDKSILESVGARLPKGILFSGPPGTGKTFMAKAIAGEAGVPFFSVNGSKFMEIYVGQGPKNVRELYATARKNAPCIVFIDEIDAIGGMRQSMDSNSERRNTLNALLTELDGLNGNTGIMTIAATNTPEDLDPALVRAGRFDRKITIPLPDADERRAILRIHCKNKRMAKDVDLDAIARSASGFSGSELAMLANEAALQAAMNHRPKIEREDFETAMYQVITEGEKKRVGNASDRRMIAYHEAGHALIIKLVQHRPVPYITNISSTSGVGGFTMHGEKTSSMTSRKQMQEQIMVCYGGRAAEEIYFGNKDDATNGASADIRQATKLIKQYIGAYGMSDSVGMLNMDELIGKSDERVVEEAKTLSNQLYQETLKVLKDNKDKLVRVAEALYKEESLMDEDLDHLLAE